MTESNVRLQQFEVTIGVIVTAADVEEALEIAEDSVRDSATVMTVQIADRSLLGPAKAREAFALRTPSDGEVVAWRGRYEHPGEEPDEWHLFHGKPANGHADWRSYPLYARSQGMEVTDEMVERFMEGWNDSHPEMSHDMRPSVRAGLRSALSPGKE